MKTEVAGLELWGVRVRFSEKGAPQVATLWITTRKNSVADAENKAKQYLAKEKPEWDNPDIQCIENNGTIDA